MIFKKSDLKNMAKFLSKYDNRIFTRHFMLSDYGTLCATNGHVLAFLREDVGSKDTFSFNGLGNVFYAVELDPNCDHLLEKNADGSWWTEKGAPVKILDSHCPNVGQFVKNQDLIPADKWINVNVKYQYDALTFLEARRTFCMQAYTNKSGNLIYLGTNKATYISKIVI